MLLKTAVYMCILVGAVAYPSGPPPDVCDKVPREPYGHGDENYLRADECPFMMIGFPWVPGTAKQIAIMTYEENSRSKFRGFIATVTKNDEPIGTMILPEKPNDVTPASAETQLMCNNQSITHADNKKKSEVLFKWLPPADLSVDDVLQLRLTIVGDSTKENWIDCRLSEYSSFTSEANTEFPSTTTVSTPTTSDSEATPSTTTTQSTTLETTTTQSTTLETTTTQSTTPEPTTSPSTPAPRTPESRTPEPQTPEPVKPEHQTPEPQAPAPQAPESQTPEPQTPEPQTPEPATQEPRAPAPSPPESSAPEPKAPEPTTRSPVVSPTIKPTASQKTPEVRPTNEKDVKPSNKVDSYLMYGQKMDLKHHVMSTKTCEEGKIEFTLLPGKNCEQYEVSWGGLNIKYQYKCPMGHKDRLKFDPRVCTCTTTKHCPI